MRNITIKPSGRFGVEVLNADGTPFKGCIRSLDLHIDVESPGWKATMQLVDPLVTGEVSAQARCLIAHPVTGDLREVRAIVFADGDRFEF